MSADVQWRDMLVQGGTVSAEWQGAAWLMLIDCDYSPASLEATLRSTGPIKGRDADVPEGWSSWWYMQEIANRMRQKARKGGVIAFTGKPRKWRFAIHPEQQ